MSNRYWVGGTGNWNDDDNHWATTSGGSPAAGNLPTSSDDVFIDANSGFESGGTIIVDNYGNCHDFTCTSGHTYTILGISAFNIYGSITFESGLTINLSDYINLLSTETETVTINGATITLPDNGIQILAAGSWTLQDDLVLSGGLLIFCGTFDANDHNITAKYFYFYADTGCTPTVYMRSGTWETTINGTHWEVDECSGEVVTFVPGTSTIKCNIGGSSAQYFYGQGHIYNNIWITGGRGKFYFDDGGNTFNELKIDTPPRTIYFMPEEITYVNNFITSGTSGNLITIDSSDLSTQHILSKSSGTVSCDYLNISNSNVTGGATWYAGSHSVDTTNNDGWIFEDKPTPLSPKVIVKNKLNLLSIGSL